MLVLGTEADAACAMRSQQMTTQQQWRRRRCRRLLRTRVGSTHDGAETGNPAVARPDDLQSPAAVEEGGQVRDCADLNARPHWSGLWDGHRGPSWASVRRRWWAARPRPWRSAGLCRRRPPVADAAVACTAAWSHRSCARVAASLRAWYAHAWASPSCDPKAGQVLDTGPRRAAARSLELTAPWRGGGRGGSARRYTAWGPLYSG